MARNLYENTAAELATGSVEHVSYDTAPGAVAEWIVTNSYDAAPVDRNGDPVGFIHEDDVEFPGMEDRLVEFWASADEYWDAVGGDPPRPH